VEVYSVIFLLSGKLIVFLNPVTVQGKELEHTIGDHEEDQSRMGVTDRHQQCLQRCHIHPPHRQTHVYTALSLTSTRRRALEAFHSQN